MHAAVQQLQRAFPMLCVLSDEVNPTSSLSALAAEEHRQEGLRQLICWLQTLLLPYLAEFLEKASHIYCVPDIFHTSSMHLLHLQYDALDCLVKHQTPTSKRR